ncbi:MAG: hypothetical protein ACLFQV_02960 [Vulcanimicrobiota bacterium]
MKKIDIKLICFTLIILLTITNLKAAYVPSVVETDKDAQIMLSRALDMLRNKLSMNFQRPIKVELKTGPELDAIASDSHYKGAIVGLHTMKNGVHMVYMMKDAGRDDFFGTICHELTHGWQAENCPGQSLILKEGTAVWVQQKCLLWDGAYIKANRLNQVIGDPVYGVGYRFVQELEDKVGETKVLAEVKKLKDIK